MTNTVTSLLTLLVGSIIVIGGIATRSEDVVSHATTVTNAANLHQIATVLELYYSDHNAYPDVVGGANLINLLEEGRYIRNRPIDSEAFVYEPLDGAQDYFLKVVSVPPKSHDSGGELSNEGY